MDYSCFYKGTTPLNNFLCNNCELFLSTCTPMAGHDGLALASECDIYLCEVLSDNF